MSNLTPGHPGFVERLLADQIGLDVASVGAGLIYRGVETRMKRLGVRRLEDYERILLGPTDEIQALIEEVVIPESWFFRDDRPFATFRQFVQEGWVEQPLRPPISVLCLPCASGEEPYSVAIALNELGLPRERFEVVAVDISEYSIRRAAAGLYSTNAFRGMNPKIQAEYFTPAQGRYLLKAAVRSAVRFVRGNILDPRLLGDQMGFDVVFCRNLLIYLDNQARVKAFANLDRLTAVGGILFLGHADRSDQEATTRFLPYAGSGSFAYQKQPITVSTAPPIAPKPRPAPQLVTARAPRAKESASTAPTPATPRAKIAPTEAGPADQAEVLRQASTLADQGKYIEATLLVERHIGRGSLDASAHFLLGIIQQAAGNRSEAEAELTKAIYLNPEHDEALFAMALLARRKGDVAAEATYRRRAERVMARKGRT